MEETQFFSAHAETLSLFYSGPIVSLKGLNPFIEIWLANISNYNRGVDRDRT